MKQTTNYNLKKIELTDSPPDITVHSGNFDIIDEELKRLDDDKVDKEEDKQLSDENYTKDEKDKLADIEEEANNYTHPTGAGNKHIPSGGASGQVLKYAGTSGTAKWENEAVTDVIDNLTSSDTDKALSAKQGKALSDTIGPLANLLTTIKTSIVNAINSLKEDVDGHLADYTYQIASGTGTAITLTINNLKDGYPITFIASTSNNGASTTINGKALYKPNTTTTPTLIAGKAYTVWYNQSGDCFFIKASAEGTASVSNVLAGKTFSNDNDTGLTGTIPSKTAQTYTPKTTNQTIASGQYLSGVQTILGDPDLVAGNILRNKNIFGVAGNVRPLKYASGSVATPENSLSVSGLAFTPNVVAFWIEDRAYTANSYGFYINDIGLPSSISNTVNWYVSSSSNATRNAIKITADGFYMNDSGINRAAMLRWVALLI